MKMKPLGKKEVENVFQVLLDMVLGPKGYWGRHELSCEFRTIGRLVSENNLQLGAL